MKSRNKQTISKIGKFLKSQKVVRLSHGNYQFGSHKIQLKLFIDEKIIENGQKVTEERLMIKSKKFGQLNSEDFILQLMSEES